MGESGDAAKGVRIAELRQKHNPRFQLRQQTALARDSEFFGEIGSECFSGIFLPE